MILKNRDVNFVAKEFELDYESSYVALLEILAWMHLDQLIISDFVILEVLAESSSMKTMQAQSLSTG